MMRVVAACLLAACFSKPPPPNIGDAGGDVVADTLAIDAPRVRTKVTAACIQHHDNFDVISPPCGWGTPYGMVSHAEEQLRVAAYSGELGACITGGTMTGNQGTWVTIAPTLSVVGDNATFEVRMGIHRGTLRITANVTAATVTLEGGIPPVTITRPYDPVAMRSWWFLPDEAGSDHTIEVWYSANATTWTHATTWPYGGLSLFSMIILLQGETPVANPHHVVSFDDFNEPCL